MQIARRCSSSALSDRPSSGKGNASRSSPTIRMNASRSPSRHRRGSASGARRDSVGCAGSADSAGPPSAAIRSGRCRCRAPSVLLSTIGACPISVESREPYGGASAAVSLRPLRRASCRPGARFFRHRPASFGSKRLPRPSLFAPSSETSRDKTPTRNRKRNPALARNVRAHASDPTSGPGISPPE